MQRSKINTEGDGTQLGNAPKTFVSVSVSVSVYSENKPKAGNVERATCTATAGKSHPSSSTARWARTDAGLALLETGRDQRTLEAPSPHWCHALVAPSSPRPLLTARNEQHVPPQRESCKLLPRHAPEQTTTSNRRGGRRCLCTRRSCALAAFYTDGDQRAHEWPFTAMVPRVSCESSCLKNLHEQLYVVSASPQQG